MGYCKKYPLLILLGTAFALEIIYGVSDALPYWKAASYYGVPIYENNVGGVIFDPGIGGSNPECYNTNGTVTFSLLSCPFDALSYFGVRENKVVLANSYSLIRKSPFIPDCLIACQDPSTNISAVAGLTIYLIGANTVAPVWSNAFPRNITLKNLEPYQFLLDTVAIDDDLDKSTAGRVTYTVSAVDGEPGGAWNYLVYDQGGNSSKLMLFNSPPWPPGSQHSVVINARDNPSTGTPNVIALTLTIFAGLNTSTYSQPSTTTSTTTTTSTSSEITAAAAAVVATTALSNCNGIAVLTCDENWIWLVCGVGGFLLLAGLVAVLITFVKDRNRGTTVIRPFDQHRTLKKSNKNESNKTGPLKNPPNNNANSKK